MARINERFSGVLVEPPVIESFDTFNQVLVVVFKLQGWGLLENTWGEYGVDSLTAAAADILHQLIREIAMRYTEIQGALYGLDGIFYLREINPIGYHRGYTEELYDKGLVDLPDLQRAFIFEGFRCTYYRQRSMVKPPVLPSPGTGAYDGNDYGLGGGNRVYIPPMTPGGGTTPCSVAYRFWDDANGMYAHLECPVGWLYLLECRCHVPGVLSTPSEIQHGYNAWTLVKNKYGQGIDYWVWDISRTWAPPTEEWKCFNARYTALTWAMWNLYPAYSDIDNGVRYWRSCISEAAANQRVSPFLYQQYAGKTDIFPGTSLNHFKGGQKPYVYGGGAIPAGYTPHVPIILGMSLLLKVAAAMGVWYYLTFDEGRLTFEEGGLCL